MKEARWKIMGAAKKDNEGFSLFFLRKIFLILITAIFLFPNICRAEKYKAKGWIHFAFLSFGWSGPPSMVEMRGGRIALGFSSPINFGIGMELIEAIMEKEGWLTRNVGSFYIYWVPFINWTKKEDNLFDVSASKVFYLFFRFNRRFHWKDTKLMGMGIHYSLFPPFLSFYAETGISSYYTIYKINPFVNIGISFIAGFSPIGLKER